MRLSHSLPGTMAQIIQAVKQHGLEGIIAERLDSKYHPDRRGDDWLKLPLKPSQYFVIGAYRLDGKRLELLLVGYFENSNSCSPPKSTKASTPPIAARCCESFNLWPLPTSKSGRWGEGVTADEMPNCAWLRPDLEAEIKFAEWTASAVAAR